VRRILLFAVLAVVLWAPREAAATATLGYQVNGAGTADDVVTITGSTVEGFQAKYSASCPILFGSCAFTVSSINQLTESIAQCSPSPAGSTTEFSCDSVPGGDIDHPGRVSVIGTPGGETVEGSCFFASVSLSFTGNEGNDRVTIGCGGSIIDLGPGDDDAGVSSRFAVLSANTIIGGDGNDRITGVNDPDTFQGGAGRDILRAGAGNDSIDGGPGRDTVDGGPGTDAIAGGDGTDVVTYEDRAGSEPLMLSLDGVANDGAPGENDAVSTDVEDAIGGAGDDTISGGAGNNEIEGGDGGDVIDGLGGRDTIDGGTGNDRITSRDGIQESIECGEGNDLAVTDEFDSALNCESVQASRELMPDVDNDGVAAPVDCDDRNASRRPGLPDKPGNRVDENCDGADTPFNRVVTPVQSVFSTSNGRTRVLRLRVLDIPAGAVIQLRCKGGKKRDCFKGTKRFRIRRGAASKKIRGPVKNRRLRAKARLEVRVLAPDSIGEVVRYTMRAGSRLPATTLRCINPGAKSRASADRRVARCPNVGPHGLAPKDRARIASPDAIPAARRCGDSTAGRSRCSGAHLAPPAELRDRARRAAHRS
jgi:Ca2+-binding RTX toxin-like protein